MLKKHTVIITIIIFICLSLGIGFGVMVIKLASTREINLNEQHTLLLDNMQASIKMALHSVRLASEFIALLPDTKLMLATESEGLDSVRKELQRVMGLFPMIEFASILDNNLKPILTSYPIKLDVELKQQAYLRQALKGRRTLSHPFNSPVTGSMVLAAASPIVYSGEIVGVSVSFINVQKMANATTNIFSSGKTGIAMLVDAHGRYILHPDVNQIGKFINSEHWSDEIQINNCGLSEGMWNGMKRIVAFSTLPETDWKVMVSMEHDEYMLPVSNLRATAFLMGGSMLIVIVIGVSWLILLLTRNLEQAKQSAEESGRAKSDFLANMSHEIRTPMNAILGLAHLMMQTKLTPLQVDYMKKLILSGKGLMGLLNDMLDLSKIESGKLEMDCCNFSLDDVLLLVNNIFAHKIAEKRLRFEIKVTDNVPKILYSDVMRLGQILINMVSNAVKFTEAGQIMINIDAVPTDPGHCTCCQANLAAATLPCLKLNISVSDTGIGMTQAHLKHLFQPFSQVDNSTTRKYGGTGLGLVICKHLVELLGGKISVNSAWGKGTIFKFYVVCCEGRADKISREFCGSPLVDESLKFMQPLDLEQEKAETTTVASHVNQPQVLLVEDNEINQLVATELLTHLGMQVKVANNGLEAVTMTEQQHFDLIFMDIQMPIMDGCDATKKIRQRDKITPIIAMTAHARPTDHEKSLEAGMNEHITKPISPETLQMIVKRFLSGVRG